MIRNKILTLALLATTTMFAGAQNLLTPIAQKASVVAAPQAEIKTLFEEDFEKMSAGSEDAPDVNNIADKQTGSISAAYTTLPGWSGAAIYQAGGACAILKGKFSDGMGGSIEDTGFLRTPQGAYAGDLTITFIARLLKSDKASDKMDIALLNSKGRLESKIVDVTPQWETFELNFTKGEFSGCLIQFAMQSEEVLIDDIAVTVAQTSIPAPVALEATDYTLDGFTANWAPTYQADKYLLTVYEKKVDEAITYADFEEINVIEGSHKIDKNNPGFPEGWTIAYGSTRNADHFSDNGYENTKGMIFRATGEGFITPTFDRDIIDFSFWASHPSGHECISHFVMSVFANGQWTVLGNYDVERISKDGKIIHLSANIPEGTRAIQIYFKKNEQNDAGKDVSIVIDHIRIMTDPEPVAVRSDIETTDYSYVVDGLDPVKDYSYTVRAVNADYSSANSNEISAYGLSAPTTTGATDVDKDCYTATWETHPKADGYVVSNYRVYTVTEAVENVEILHETFDKVTEGSVEAPVGLYNVVNPLSLDAYTSTSGWLGIATYLAKGMLGTRSYMGITGMIQTPVLDLSGNNGKFTVRLKIVADTDAHNEYVIVQAGMEEYIAMPIEAGETVVREYDFECGLAQMPLAIYSQNGYPFYIDEMTVTQTLANGDKVFYPIEERVIADDASTSTKFDGLSVGPNISYAYRVFAYRDFMGSRKYSMSDGAVMVTLKTSGIEDIVSDSNDGPATYYRIDGVALPERPTTPGLYIRRTAGKAEVVRINN